MPREAKGCKICWEIYSSQNPCTVVCLIVFFPKSTMDSQQLTSNVCCQDICRVKIKQRTRIREKTQKLGNQEVAYLVKEKHR